MAKKAEFEISDRELSAVVEHYFSECEENSRKPTAPGLCVALGISLSKFQRVIGSTAAKRSGHARVLEMAQLRLIDDIEQRTDSMSVSRAKQPIYTLGSLSSEKSGGITVKVELRGLKRGDEPFS
jgi:hypothetical protein